MKLDIIFHYDVNETTGEIIYIGKDEIKVDTEKKSTSTKKSSNKIDNNAEPLVTLETNKLVLTQGAVDLLSVCEDCRIDIKYDKKGNPLIGTDQAFGTKSGNKLTKSNTVSFRGAANTKLSGFGNIFKLDPTKDDGIFYLVGDKNPHVTEIPEELIDIESELDIENLDDLDKDLDSTNLSDFDFTL